MTENARGGPDKARGGPDKAGCGLDEAGCEPGKAGCEPDEDGVVVCLHAADGRWREIDDPFGEALARKPAGEGAFVWLALSNPPADRLAELSRVLDLGEALDVADAGADDTLRFDIGTLDRSGARVRTGQLTLVVGAHYVVTVHRGGDGVLAAAAHVLRDHRRRAGADRWAVVRTVVQQVVSGYPAALEAVAGDISALEEQVFSEAPDGSLIGRAHQLKSELVELRRTMVPAQRPLGALAEGEEPDLAQEVRRHLRQLREEVVQSVEQLNGYDDLLNSMVEARMAQISVAQNDDMRKIAAWAALLAAQTVIAGIYGMNFENMPELDWTLGYPAVIALMLAVAVALYWRFRRSGWL
ncbi:magnesium transporter CorA [Pilimelia terevasa]|uniref:Magnesium transporter CorA n=1 Tax=Pilimelia terevasa TaxID=53372 RepID=A0A8J3FJK9_9ACTN|nr:CorA family divalent cation transporter [Pilimelia terevasa]GGK33992.1 magnesium transporter CorA [Pilimelia terevasa]